MTRYIDVEPIISESEKELKILEQKMLRGVSGAGAAAGTLTGIIARLADTPTADVEEVKHAKWAYKLDCNGYGCYECSCCKTLHEYDTDYCPNCGAKMDGGNLSGIPTDCEGSDGE